MKKLTQILAFALAVILTASLALVAVSGEDEVTASTVYLDDSGDDENEGKDTEHPVKTLTRAFELLGLEGGTVAVVDTYTHSPSPKWFATEAEGMKNITLTGCDEDSTFIWDRSLNPQGPLTVEYLHIKMNKNYSYLNANGHKLVMGKGITVSRSEGITCDLLIRGGGDTNIGVDGDTNVIIYSGTYSSIHGGSRNADITGDTHITVYGGNIAGIIGGNNNGSDGKDKVVKGGTYITIYGGNVTKCLGDDSNNRVEGKKVLDVSRYPLANPDWYSSFDEVKEYDPNLADAGKEIKVKAEGAFINGYSDGTFRPQNTITRAEAMTIISRLIASEDEIKSGEYETALKDLPKDAWYFKNVAYLESLGLLDFIERKGIITPTQPITREEVCGLLYGLADTGSIKIPSFTDVTLKNNMDAIAALASMGVVNGYSDGTFRPDGTITRAEFVTMTDRFLGRKATENADSASKFSDISNHWAKSYIIAASSERTVDGKEVWKVDKDVKKFALSENAKTPADYINELRLAIPTLTAEAVTDGIEEISQKRIEEIRNTPNTDITVTGKTYYVSADGDDSADGLTEATAWKTLSKVSTASLSKGDAVLFRRGDLFRGQLNVRTGITYSAYGEGAKPKIYGWDKNSADPALWKETDVKGVWEYAEKYNLDIGNIIFDDKTTARKVIRSDEKDGTHLDYRANRVFNDYHDLTEDMTFYHDYKGTGKLYLRCEAGNPGSLYDDIEMAKKQHTIAGGNSYFVTIDNLEIAYAGSHGIGFGSAKGLTVTNCEMKWIGGSIQMDVGGYGRTWPTPYGNAIEIYGEAEDYTVNNCYIWQAYDAGITHQSGSTVLAHDKNIHYTDNVIEKCVYAIEIFVGESDTVKSTQDGVYIENNILRMGGGFGHAQRPDTGVTALIRNGGITKDTKNYEVTNNIFDRSGYKLISANDDGGSMAVYTDNIFVQGEGRVMIQKNGKNINAEIEARATLESFGDKGNEFIITSAESMDF